MLFVIGLFAIILAVLMIFAFPAFSPIPYFPSNSKDLSHILRLLGLKQNQYVIDLGAGDGFIIFAAAQVAYDKKLNTKFIAVELNPLLCLVLHIRRLFHKNRKNIHVVMGNIFTMNYSSILPKFKTELTFYLYISPWHIKKTIEAIKKYVSRFTVVSYMYEVPDRKHVQKAIGIHKVYKYRYV
jgi:16S rRNA A1518/A1519 N6-dimethyltransferase RsmA/KsgA/DIM1 with predicted DNA glycosylase/AP lyase activity